MEKVGSTPSTIFAISSGRPPAGIAVIRISGSRAHEAGVLLAGNLPAARMAVVREIRNPVSSELLDEALVLRFDGPASATGEDVVELHCHGGRAVVDAVVEALRRVPGLREAVPGEFTRRAFENGRVDLTEAEGLADLLEAETQSQRRAALAIVEGGLRKQIAEWQDRLLALSAMAERAIDYDDDDEAVDPMLTDGCRLLAADLATWLDQPRVEPLKQGLRVVVAGPPNAGKSSLINALAGEDRAIVASVPGTTRDVIEVPLSLDGVPIVLTDTAGLRESSDPVETIGIAKAEQMLAAADILLWLGDPNLVPDHKRTILVASKSDLAPVEPPIGLPVSAHTGQGLDRLKMEVLKLARALLPGEDAVALNRRQASLLARAHNSLREAGEQRDLPILAEDLRDARAAFQQITGQSGVENVLDQLFGRFCLGK